ncbi:MAG: hypothetical protein Q8S26_00685 [Azonexus sp.]|nr:hypothetical protein [Azonexus sp.]
MGTNAMRRWLWVIAGLALSVASAGQPRWGQAGPEAAAPEDRA